MGSRPGPPVWVASPDPFSTARHLLQSRVPASPVHAELRAATAAAHLTVETGSGVEAGLRDLATRDDTRARLLAFHAAAEAGLEPWHPGLAALGWAGPSRADQLRASGAATRPVETVMRPASLGQALGWLYVTEGSMLGGRVMLKAMRRDGVDLNGLDFLAAGGDETGSLWRAFLEVIERACVDGTAGRADVVRGATDAFELARRLLVPPSRVRVA